MSGDELKARLKELIDARSRIEPQIAAASARLDAAGVGMQGSLLDNEGYPRANIDIPAIRSDRVQVIRLTNDHKQLTQELEQILHQFHARAGHVAERHSTAAPSAAARPAGEDTAQQPRANGAHASDMHPFALIDEVFDDSPAREAGVQLRDQVVEFAGSINAQTASPLSAVATALQRNIGNAVKMVVLRDGVPAVLQLTPQSWGGRGLLGCHLKPM